MFIIARLKPCPDEAFTIAPLSPRLGFPAAMPAHLPAQPMCLTKLIKPRLARCFMLRLCSFYLIVSFFKK